MKKLVSLVLVLVMCLSMSSAWAGTYDKPESSRIVPEGETAELTIFQPLTINVESLDAETNRMTAHVEEEMGVKLNFVTATAEDAQTKLNTLLSSGDYPEVISTSMSNKLLDRTSMDYYASQGILVPLDEYITEEIAPNTYRLLQENPSLRELLTANDGKIYSLPDINECFHCLYGDGRAWYYMPWMANYEPGMPETTAEFKAYLEWIRDTDVNGNGNPSDEVPLCFYADELDYFITWIANSFMVYPYQHYRMNEDNTITACYLEDTYKEALAFAHELYKEGLILENACSISMSDLQTLGEDPQGNKFGVIIGWGPERAVMRGGESNRWYQYFTLAPMEGPTGQRNATYAGTTKGRGIGYVITDACKDVELAVRFGDMLMTPYWSLSTLLGFKGEAWGDPTSETALGYDGNPANWRDLGIPGEANANSFWNQQCITCRTSAVWNSREAEGADVIMAYLDGDASLMEEAMSYASYNELMKFYACNKQLKPYAFDGDYNVPKVLYSADVIDVVADAEALIKTARQENAAAFIMGTRSLDTFDAYVAEMEALGVQTVIDATLAALNK